MTFSYILNPSHPIIQPKGEYAPPNFGRLHGYLRFTELARRVYWCGAASRVAAGESGESMLQASGRACRDLEGLFESLLSESFGGS